MKKKIVAVLLITSVFLTSCSTNSGEMMLDYDSQVTTTSFEQSNTKDLFASDLCVINTDEVVKDDSEIAASGALIMNRTTNQNIYAKNIYEKLYPASITKIVTALVVLKHGNLDDMVTISHNAATIAQRESGAQTCGFPEGSKVQLRVLLTSLLVHSGNDVGIAIAEHMAGSEEAFAKMMNEEAKKIGATSSHFMNPHGLHEEEHYTTVYDLYLFFNEDLKYDEFRSIINLSKYQAEYTTSNGTSKKMDVTWANSNKYLSSSMYKAPEGITVWGGKTGTTDAAGKCLIILSTDSSKNEYISVALHAGTSSQESVLYATMNKLLGKIAEQE